MKRLAELTRISRAQIDRILDLDKGNVTIETLQRGRAGGASATVRVAVSVLHAVYGREADFLGA
jgi:hypothetical protein